LISSIIIEVEVFWSYRGLKTDVEKVEKVDKILERNSIIWSKKKD